MIEASSSTSDLKFLEQQIEERVQHWYTNHLGHTHVKVCCHIFGNKLMIVLDEAVTQPERLLVASGRLDFAQQMHTALDQILRLHLQQTIESLTQVRIVDLLTATQLDTERTSIVAILSEAVTPQPLAVNPPNSHGRVSEHGGE